MCAAQAVGLLVVDEGGTTCNDSTPSQLWIILQSKSFIFFDNILLPSIVHPLIANSQPISI